MGADIARSLGFLNKIYKPMGPFPLEDTLGMAAAIVTLQSSLKPGIHDKTVQYGTVRKLRSSISNIYHASVAGQGNVVMAKDTKKLTVTKCPTYGVWYERFMRGMHKRMGEIVKPDRALSLDILLEIMNILENAWSTVEEENKYKLAEEGSFYLIGYLCALRGEEIPLADVFGTQKYWESSGNYKTPHVIVALFGRFKMRTVDCYHLMPLVVKTKSGLEPRKWIGRFLVEFEKRGIFHGPMFRNSQGLRVKASDFEPKFIDRLDEVKEKFPHLMSTVENVEDEYGIYRSSRRGATLEAENRGVPPEVVNANNRWRASEKAGASQASETMRDHYIDVQLTVDHRLRFSAAL